MPTYGLSYLLKLLKISPLELSEHLNVHRTLVSKWKSGARTIDINSKYLDDLIDYILDRNKELQLNILENTINSVYGYDYSKDDSTQAELRKFIKQLIFYNEISSDTLNKIKDYHDCLYVATVPTYNDESSERKAILHILNLSEQLTVPVKLTCTYNDSFDQVMSDLEFRSCWIKRILNLLDRGFKLTIVFSSYINNASIFMDFHDLIFHKNCELRKYVAPIGEIAKLSFHLVENIIVLTSYQVLKEKKIIHSTTVHTDPVAIEIYSTICAHIIKRSTPIFINTKISTSFIEERKYNPRYNENGLEAWHDTMYYYNEFPSYFFISEDLYKKILTQSGFDSIQIENEFKLFFHRKALIEDVMLNYKNTHFYPLKKFFELANKPIFSLPFYGYNTSKNLQITNSDYKLILNSMVKYLDENKNFEICFIPTSLFPDLSSLIIWCKKNINMYAYISQDTKRMLRCYDLGFINQIATLFEQQFLFTPLEHKQKDAIIKKIKDIIDS